MSSIDFQPTPFTWKIVYREPINPHLPPSYDGIQDMIEIAYHYLDGKMVKIIRDNIILVEIEY
jgi:hypothetical protein